MTQPVLVTASPVADNRRVKKLAAVAVVLLVVAVVVPKVLFGGGGGGSDELGLDVTPTPTTVAPGPGDATDATGGDPAEHPISAKDPFHPLVALAASGSGGAATPPPVEAPPVPATSDPSAPVLFPTFPTFPTSPAPTPTTVPSGVQAAPIPTPAPSAIRTFSLESVYRDGTGLVAATVRVDTTSYAVTAGQDFAFSYRALSLNSDSLCGVFLYGDKRFSLCQGEKIRT